MQLGKNSARTVLHCCGCGLTTVKFRTVMLIGGLMILFWISCGGESSEQPATSAPPPVIPATPSSTGDSRGSGAVGEKAFGPFKVAVPAGWVEQAPASSMRKAQFALHKLEGDSADGELVVFYFGAGQGGGVEANIERWVGQFGQPDGSSSKEKAKTSKKEVSGFAVTTVDVTGIYQAPIMPGAPERHNSPGYRMMAAVVETGEGPWFFKLVGPEKTVAKWSESFEQFISSIRRL